MDWQDRLSWRWRSDVRLTRLRQALRAAQYTRAYPALWERAGLAGPDAVATLSSIEEELPKLPIVDFSRFCSSPDDFQNPSAPLPPCQRLRFPTAQEPRTAVLAPGFVETSRVRVFRPAWIGEIRRFHPEAIAGPIRALKPLAKAARAGSVPAVTNAVVVFTGLEHAGLSEAERDWLWRAFEVPIFEQFLGPDGCLMAWECEAHDGLHTVDRNALFEQGPSSRLIVTSLTARRHPTIRIATRLEASLRRDRCGCGRLGLRLMSMSAAPVQRMAAAAGSVTRSFTR